MNFFTKIAHGDFGMSTRSKRPVSTEIGERFMPTLMLTLVSMVWATAFGMAIGIASAVWRNRWPDRLGMTLAVSGISFPAFALGMLLMEVFSVKLGWLPVVPDGSWKSYVLPSLTLGAAVAAVMARFTRASFVEVLNEDFVRTARAKGVHEPMVVLKHCLRNAMIPVVTMMGLQFGFLLGGSIVVEVVFNWPGNRPPARRCGDDARLPGDPGDRVAVFARVHPDQPDRRRAVRGHQPDHPVQVRPA